MKKERERELEIVREMNSCVHFTGIHQDTCKAGVEYRSLVGGPDLGWATRIPCIVGGFEPKNGPRVECELKKCPNREEAIAEVDRSNTRLEECLTALDAAHADAKSKGFKVGNGGRSGLPCPICKTGALNYTVASINGHMHAMCTTDGCVRWME